jgi:dienelactone hydrolase
MGLAMVRDALAQSTTVLPMRALLVSSLLAVTACGPDRTALLYSPAKTFKVDTVDHALTYTTADSMTPARTITLRIRTPRGATGPLPMVIVIHGGGFNPNGHNGLEDWGAQLAAAGFVAVNFGNAEDEGNAHCTSLMIPVSECTAALLTKEVSAGGTIPVWLYTRPQDAKAIVDQLSSIEQKASVQVDRDRLGVLGHSAGSHAVMSLAGVVVDVSPSLKARAWNADARFKAFVANSPQGLNSMGLMETSWGAITRPVLIQTGKRDSTEGEQAPSRRHPYPRLPGPNAYEHYIDDDAATHSVFALEKDEGVAGHELSLARTGLAFFDAFLNGRDEAKQFLAGNALSRASGGLSTLSKKE